MSERIYSWEDIERLTFQLANQIKKDSVDLLMGISVGGLVPTALLSLELGLKNVTTVSARSYEGKTQKPLSLHNFPQKETVEGSNLLLIDDIVDTGATISAVRDELIQELGARSVASAALVVKEEAPFNPDYYVEKVSEWVVFPWEKSFKSKDKGKLKETGKG